MDKFLNLVRKISKKKVISIILIITLIPFLAGAIYYITIDDGTYKEDDWSNTPYAAAQYTSNIALGSDGTITTSMTAQEIWDKLISEGSNVSDYLNGPEDLLKMMNAELVTQFMDIREDPDEEIDWEKVNSDVNSKNVQGIIKMRRANSDGTKTTMTYVDPDTFQSYINEYNSSGSEEAKENAMKHFTLGTSGSSTTTNKKKVLNGVEMTVLRDGDGIVTTYNADGSAIEGPPVDRFGQPIADGKCAVKDGYIKDHSVIYIETSETGEGSHANGKFYYVCDTGGGLVEGQVDVYANGDQSTINAAPYGRTESATISLVEEDVTWQEYLDKYYNATISESNGNNQDNNNNSKDTTTSASGTELKVDVSDKIVSAAQSTPSAGAGMCLKWVSNVYQNAGLGACTGESARISCQNNMISDSRDNIPIGAAVYGSGSGRGNYGHVGIYVGDGKVMDCIRDDSINTSTLEEWIAWQEKSSITLDSGETVSGYIGWGWPDGVNRTAGEVSSSSGSSTIQFYAKVATWSETTNKIESNDPEVGNSTSTSYTMKTTNVNYQGMVKAYTMPFQYLWAFMVLSEDRDFVLELADLVENSQIEFTVYDNFTETTTVNTTSRTVQEVTKDADGNEKTETHVYTTTRTTINRNNTLTIKPTLVDVWMAKYTQEYTYEEPVEEVTEEGETKTTKKVKKYVSAPLQIQEKVDETTAPNFVTIFLSKNNSKARDVILSATSWLFEILETNEDTVDLVDLTKYLLFKATGISYGVEEYDFESLWNQMYASLTNFAAGDIIVNTEMINSEIVIEDEDVLEEAIQAVTSGQAQANLLGVLHNGTFMELQETYHVNAVFAIAVTIVESGGGVSWSAIPSYTHNWMSMTGSYKGQTVGSNGSNPRSWRVYPSFDEATLDFGDQIANGSYYFQAGKYTVKEIAPTYCDEAWGESVMQFMIKMYEAVGIVATTSSGGSAQIGEAASIQGVEERIAWLYDGNGLPTSKAENDKYLETFPVEYLDRSGSRQTMNVTMHRKLKTEIQAIFKEMADAGFKVIGGDISYRAWGSDAGFKGRFPQSAHTYGHAFDVNPNENYCIYANGTVVGSHYSPGSDPYSVTEPIINIWKQHGFYWGGDWTSLKDYMHFSYFNH